MNIAKNDLIFIINSSKLYKLYQVYDWEIKYWNLYNLTNKHLKNTKDFDLIEFLFGCITKLDKMI